MVTMADIARKAGVSRATASYVLNDRQTEMRISDETQRRVMAVAAELGYRRNDLARAVKSGKSYVLGYLQMAHVELETRIQEGVLKTASEAGYLLKLLPWGDATVEQVARLCVEQRLAGVITRSLPKVGDTIAFFTELESYGIPVVFMDDSLEGLALPRMSWVTSDDDQGIRLAVEHLIGLGHYHIGFIGGYILDRLHPQEFRRLDAFHQVMAAHDLPVPERFVLEAKWNTRLTERLVRELYQNNLLLPTALLCAGAEPALVAIRTLRRMGLHVPEDVSVIGYSDFAFAPLIDPPLTTVSQPFEEMGAVATQILLSKLQEESSEQETGPHILLPTSLVVRESTAVPPAGQGRT
jgi:DNA-binding LacI/PurR family transcriptional regulator